FRPGGVHQDLPPGLLEDIGRFCDGYLKVLDDIDALLIESRIFKQRNVDIGVITRADAEMWGFSGVMLRSAGVAWDLRRAQPYECYNDFDFQIPIGRQCIEKMPSGPVSSSDNKVVPPKRAEMKSSMEALIHHFKLYTEGFHVP